LVNFLSESSFVKVSAGFQHSLFLNEKGEVFGCGKSDKFQIGKEYLEYYHSKPSFKGIFYLINLNPILFR
jgi:alpha-tubulin suppressor-like RCC1 family protein